MSKQRLDLYLTSNSLSSGRDKAKAQIMAGEVYVNGEKALQASQMVKPSDVIEVRSRKDDFVSRGGHKLHKAIGCFSINLEGKTAIDIGASTGGFTDCMLRNGAAKVTCIDVGYGQLDYNLRNDPRIVNMERTNIRYVTTQMVETADFICIDVSFISLKLVLPVAFNLLEDDGQLVCLIKPQFEAGRSQVKKGVVKDGKIHNQVISSIIDFSIQLGFYTCGLDYSPITGPAGNIEYLLYLSKTQDGSIQLNPDDTIESAFIQLNH